MQNQKELNEQCQNNFECTTNSCINGKCIDLEEQLGLLKKLWCKISNFVDDEGYEKCLIESI